MSAKLRVCAHYWGPTIERPSLGMPHCDPPQCVALPAPTLQGKFLLGEEARAARFSDLKIGQFGMVLKRRKEKLGKTQGKYWIFTILVQNSLK